MGARPPFLWQKSKAPAFPARTRVVGSGPYYVCRRPTPAVEVLRRPAQAGGPVDAPPGWLGFPRHRRGLAGQAKRSSARTETVSGRREGVRAGGEENSRRSLSRARLDLGDPGVSVRPLLAGFPLSPARSPISFFSQSTSFPVQNPHASRQENQTQAHPRCRATPADPRPICLLFPDTGTRSSLLRFSLNSLCPAA